MNVLEYLQQNIVILDGAMGTQLQKRGIKPGELPEEWNITHEEDIIEIQKSYFDSGSNIVNTNTFGANSLKFSQDKLEEIIKKAVYCAKEARDRSTGTQEKFISGDLGPLGRLLKPYGDLDFEEAVEIFKTTAILFQKYGVDLISIETMNDSYETKAAVLAVKESTTLPVFVTNAYSEDDKLMTGATPESMVAILEGLNVDAIGLNCSYGPKELLNVAKRLVEVSSTPIIFKPNAGLPHVENGKTVFDIDENEFALGVSKAIDLGVRVVGGCCGTSPAYIEKLSEIVKDKEIKAIDKKKDTVVTSSQTRVVFDDVVLIGERINPTGNKRVKEAVKNNEIDFLLNEGINEENKGVKILDVNVGVPGIDEVSVLTNIVYELQSVVKIPLSIDTSNVEALEKALRIYNGKPLINSVNGKEESLESVLPLVKKYGGVVIALTLDENGIPDTADERVEIAKRIIEKAKEYGIDKKDIIFDSLTMSISTNENAGKITVEAVKKITELGCKTTLGVSNISFGMPNRDEINRDFFLYAMQNGLSSAIMNPYSDNMMKAYSDFTGKKDVEVSFDKTIESTMEKIESSNTVDELSVSPLQYAIIKGLRDKAYSLTKETLSSLEGIEIVEKEIIPALDIVGKSYEDKTMYLPQLLMAAESAKSSFEAIKEKMPNEKPRIDGKIIIATVKGDIHDIGKNIVKLLLQNYGFDVIDLGKDVDPLKIVEVAIEKDAKIVCLSALMTTTLPSMEETIKLLHDKDNNIKICVGGAVLTKEYAESIGADMYSKDAMGTVRYAEQILK